MSSLIAVHTLLSIGAILIGAVAIADVLKSQARSTSITLFLASAIATSATGYLLPLKGLTPAVIVGFVALAILAGVLVARGRLPSSPYWRWTYAGGLVASLYLLVFVAIAQAFAKIPILHDAAPTQSEIPFVTSQAVVLLIFVVLGAWAVRTFHPAHPAEPPMTLPTVPVAKLAEVP
jgi:hypothetical protein